LIKIVWKVYVYFFYAGDRIRKREYQLRRTIPDLRTRFAKCVEVDGGIFRTIIVICNKFVMRTLN
jgi:hypothetical protein